MEIWMQVQMSQLHVVYTWNLLQYLLGNSLVNYLAPYFFDYKFMIRILSSFVIFIRKCDQSEVQDYDSIK